MANELITREDIVRGKKNFDAFDGYLDGSASEKVTLPSGKKIKTRAGVEQELKDSFSGTVALKQSGIARGRVPLAEDVFSAAYNFLEKSSEDFDLNDMPANSRLLCSRTNKNSPSMMPDVYFLAESFSTSPYSDNCVQIARGTATGASFIRSKNLTQTNPWSEWSGLGTTAANYSATTATSANAVLTVTGEIQRSTSSKIFKKDIEDISIPDYRAALKAVRPVSYRSTDATSDRTDWSWYSFIAEEIAAIDPRLAQMDSVEFFEDTDEDGTPFINSRDLPEGEYAANGINTNGIVALMVHINQQMLTDIETLESEKTQMKSRMTKLEKRLDALEQSAQPTAK